MTPQQKAAAFRDPVLYQKNVLLRRLWSKQEEIIRSVIANPLTCCKGCHASGKTFTAMGLPLWWLTRHQHSRVFTTAPTLRQVKAHWRDIHTARSNSPLCKQTIPQPTITGIMIDSDRYAEGASSNSSVNLQGMHAPNVLIIADEAPGISADIWPAIEGIRSGGHVRVLKLGNPTVPSGDFYDSFTKHRAIYNPISISAFDTPNFQRPDGSFITEEDLLAMSAEDLAYNPFPGLITRSWVRERLAIWGTNHPQYQSRVLAQFPGADPYSIFALDWIERAKRDPTTSEINEANRIGWMQVGIDVAGAGSDETVLTVRIGGIILEQHYWPDADSRGRVAAVLQRLAQGKYLKTPANEDWIHRIEARPLRLVVVDTIGIGYNFAFHLADMGFPIWGFNAGARPVDAAQFVNAKAEAHWTFRTYLQEDLVAGLADEETAAQLSTIRYRENSRGLIEIESKDERNKRGIPGSPDRCESVVMSYLRHQPAVSGGLITDPDYQISVI